MPSVHHLPKARTTLLTPLSSAVRAVESALLSRSAQNARTAVIADRARARERAEAEAVLSALPARTS
ncbi:hypothetical protein [Streptomyces sp. NPDC047046]|uniref:hypothetical protein n=1 Tax=unclassified Streptomyces TaxID=2593676 RepID=UPI0033C90453